MSNWYYILAGVITAALILLWDILTDFKDIKQGDNINHSNQGFWRIVLLLIPTTLFTIPLIKDGEPLWYIPIAAILSFAMVGFPYWSCFDGLLANKRRFNFWYVGIAAQLDKFLRRLTPAQHITLKLGGSVLFITIYILLLL